MSDVSTTVTPARTLPDAGWYPDPAGSAQLRWWNGTEWTDHLRARPEPILPPPAPTAQPWSAVTPLPTATPAVMVPALPSALPAPQPRLPLNDGYVPMSMAARAPVITSMPVVDDKINSSVWPLAFIPIISVLLSWLTTAMDAPSSLSIGISVGLFGGCLAVATVDHRALMNRGLKPPSVAWIVLFAPIAYLIARRVVLKRQGIISHAPGNLYVVSLVASVAIAMIFVVPSITAQNNAKAVTALEGKVAQALGERTATTWLVNCPDNAPLTTASSRFACSASDSAGLAANIDVVIDERMQVSFTATQTTATAS